MRLIAVLALAASSRNPDPRSEGARTEDVLPFALGAAALGLAMSGYHFSAVPRSRRWRRGLPFRVEGFDEVLGLCCSARVAGPGGCSAADLERMNHRKFRAAFL